MITCSSANLRSKPLGLMPNNFSTKTLLEPPAKPSEPSTGEVPDASAKGKAKDKSKPSGNKSTSKVPKAKTPEQEAKTATGFEYFNIDADANVC